jgi:WD40 repeat protein
MNSAATAWRYSTLTQYELLYLPFHLQQSGSTAIVIGLLSDHEWLLEKAARVDLPHVLADFRFVHDNEGCKSIESALRMISSVVHDEHPQVPSQLLARLSRSSIASVKEFVQRLRTWRRTNWLVPLTAALTPIDTPLVQTLMGHTGPVRALAFTSPTSLVSASVDGDLIEWDLRSGSIVQTWCTGCSAALTLSRISDGYLAITATEGFAVIRLEDGVPVYRRLRGQGKCSLVCCANGLLAVAQPGRLTVVDGTSGVERLQVPTRHKHQVLATFTDANTLVCAEPQVGRNVTLRVWNIAERRVVRRIPVHQQDIKSVVKVTDVEIATSSQDMTVTIWNVVSGRLLVTYRGHKTPVATLVPIGRRLIASRERTGPLHIWNAGNARLEVKIDTPTDDFGRFEFLPTGQFVTTVAGNLMIWSFGSGTLQRVLPAHSLLIWDLKQKESSFVATASEDKTIKIWDLSVSAAQSGGLERSDSVYYVTEIRKGKVATCSSNGSVKVWNARSGRMKANLEGH